MMQPVVRLLVVVLGVVALLASGLAEAQWVLLARRAVGRVEQISQQSTETGGPSYDSAALMLEAPADRVYAAVVKGVRGAEAKGIRITREDNAAMLVQFTNGEQIAGIKVTMLGDNLTHMLVSSAHTGSQPNAAALVMDSVQRVCREMNVDCSPAQQ
ncbi:MAG TPA: hypothetical protein VIK97_00190 [Casimicrobiaceae bacterium]